MDQRSQASGSKVPGGFIQLNLFRQAYVMTVVTRAVATILETSDINDANVPILQMLKNGAWSGRPSSDPPGANEDGRVAAQISLCLTTKPA